MPNTPDNPEQQAAANPPIAPQPAPTEVPSVFDGLRVRAVNVAKGAAAIAALPLTNPVSQELGRQLKETFTDRDKVANMVIGMASGTEGEGPEGLLPKEVAPAKEVMVQPEATSRATPTGETGSLPPEIHSYLERQAGRKLTPEEAIALDRANLERGMVEAPTGDTNAIREEKRSQLEKPREAEKPRSEVEQPQSKSAPKQTPQQMVESAGLKYKGELIEGSGVHMFEHPGHPGKTAALNEKDITPERVTEHMADTLHKFAAGEAKNKGAAKLGSSEGEQSQSKKLPPIGDNYRTDLSKYTDTLHHETNVNRAMEMIPTGGIIARQPDMYFANTPDLATGQGASKGVHLEFDSKGIEGQVNRSKPMAAAAYEQGHAEFWSKINDQKTLQNNLKSITIKNDAQVTSKNEKLRMNNSLAALEKRGWAKTKTPEGIRYDRPKSPVTAEGAAKLGTKK
jgi:hypothetical protein